MGYWNKYLLFRMCGEELLRFGGKQKGKKKDNKVLIY